MTKESQVLSSVVSLPDRYMITGKFDQPETLFYKVERALWEGVRLIQFRALWLEHSDYLLLAEHLSLKVNERGGTLISKGSVSLLQQPWCQGLHLTSAQLESGIQPVKQRPDQWVVASCHNDRQLKLASGLGVDFVTLSPVQPTLCHPEAVSLGWQSATRLTSRVSVPVFWLGGLSCTDLERAYAAGAQGIAAIGAFWN